MSRIEIDAGGWKITVEHDGELETVRAAFMKLWEDTGGPQPSRGPATGFQLTDRRGTPNVNPLGAGINNKGRPPAPVTAEGADRG